MVKTQMEESSAIRIHLTHAGEGQVFLVAAVQTQSESELAADQAYTRIASQLDRKGLAIVQERLLGSLSVASQVIQVRRKVFCQHNIPTENPITYFQGHPPHQEGLAGVIIRAVAKQDNGLPQTVLDQGKPCGRSWQRKGQSFLILQNITGLIDAALADKREEQAAHMLDRADRILRQQGLGFCHVARTWIYLTDILSWYPAFNRVRNGRYQTYGIMPQRTDTSLLLPASTGIEGTTQSRAACALDLLAVREQDLIEQLSNTQQMDAFRYGSAFSRAALIHEADVSLIELSGTAAIDESGKSLFARDVEEQINCTLDNIEALLAPKGANLTDVCAATIFFKRPQDIQVYRTIADRRGLGQLPCVCVIADICRKELLFEIEAEIALDKPR